LARAGAAAYLLAGAVLVMAESIGLRGVNTEVYPAVVAYVVLAFLAQAAIGGALLQAGLLAAWAGWLMVAWNVGWLVILPILTPGDIYFPILHHVMPLVMGLLLLWTR
jgi:hypothetical protein